MKNIFLKSSMLFFVLLAGDAFSEQYIVDTWCHGPACPSNETQVELDSIGTTTPATIIKTGAADYHSLCFQDQLGNFPTLNLNFGYPLNRDPFPSGTFIDFRSGNTKALIVKEDSRNEYLATIADTIGDKSSNIRIEMVFTGSMTMCPGSTGAAVGIVVDCYSPAKRDAVTADFGSESWQNWYARFAQSNVVTIPNSWKDVSIVQSFNQDLAQCDGDLQVQVRAKDMGSLKIDSVEVRLWRL